MNGARICGVRLPCVFADQARTLLRAVWAHRPALVLAMGQAAGRSALSFERVAINLIDAPMPDNDGFSPQDEPVQPDAPPALWSGLPLQQMAQAVREAERPVEISTAAGTVVCNPVFYLLQRAARPLAVRTGFLHVSLLPEQADRQPGIAGRRE